MVGVVDCKDCGAKGFRSLGALGSHRSLACRGKVVKRARLHDADQAAPAAQSAADSVAIQEQLASARCDATSEDRDNHQSSNLSVATHADSQFVKLLRDLEARKPVGQAAGLGDDAFEQFALLQHPCSSQNNASQSGFAESLSFNLDALLTQPEIERLRKEVRTENFDDERLLRFVRGCNNGQGLHEKDQAALFSLFKKGFDPKNLNVSSVRQLKKYEAESLHLEKDVSPLYYLSNSNLKCHQSLAGRLIALLPLLNADEGSLMLVNFRTLAVRGHHLAKLASFCTSRCM
jgi:hypothetical protein